MRDVLVARIRYLPEPDRELKVDLPAMEGASKPTFPVEMLSAVERERLERFQDIFGEGRVIFTNAGPAFVAHGATFNLRDPDLNEPPAP